MGFLILMLGFDCVLGFCVPVGLALVYISLGLVTYICCWVFVYISREGALYVWAYVNFYDNIIKDVKNRVR